MTDCEVIWSSNLLATTPNLEIFCSDICFRVHKEVLACHSSLLKEIFLNFEDCGPIYLEEFQLADVRLLIQVNLTAQIYCSIKWGE